MVQVNTGLRAMCLDVEQIQDILKSTQTVLAGSSEPIAHYCGEIKLLEIVNKLVRPRASAFLWQVWHETPNRDDCPELRVAGTRPTGRQSRQVDCGGCRAYL